MKYRIEITNSQTVTYIVEAENQDAALDIIRAQQCVTGDTIFNDPSIEISSLET